MINKWYDSVLVIRFVEILRVIKTEVSVIHRTCMESGGIAPPIV
jgi:hypothetical protein